MKISNTLNRINNGEMQELSVSNYKFIINNYQNSVSDIPYLLNLYISFYFVKTICSRPTSIKIVFRFCSRLIANIFIIFLIFVV